MSTIQTSSYTDPTKLGLNNGAQKTTTDGSSSSGTLDKDGFLKLFVAQLQHQDPSSPMDTTQSMEQMASFSMVEQITNMASQNTQIANTLATSSAVGLIGRTVTYTDSSGTAQTGKVDSVATSKNGVASLTVAGKAGVDPASISTVA
jgi:flagellar basal-body rod modification protein FlgD